MNEEKLKKAIAKFLNAASIFINTMKKEGIEPTSWESEHTTERDGKRYQLKFLIEKADVKNDKSSVAKVKKPVFGRD